MTDQSVFERTHLYLILSYFISTAGVEYLNKTSKSFNYFHTMLLHVEPNVIHKLFQHDPDYASQATIPISCCS